MSRLSVGDLTFPELLLAGEALPHPVIVSGNLQRTGRRLERKGWGWVEHGAPGERIFRLSQAGTDALMAIQQMVRA